MLPLSCCRSDGPFNSSNLRTFLSEQKTMAEDRINSEIAFFEQIRSDAVTVRDASEEGQKKLLRYCHHLRSFVPRLSNMEKDVKLSLEWSDAFGGVQKKILANNLRIDWACCIWNLGAFESILGSRVDRGTEEGIRQASKHFQQSAGYFRYIQEHLHEHVKMINLPCLCEESLQFVHNLMLAQAQLCFYEKAVRDKKKDLMKPGILAKLGMQTSAFYSAASVASKLGMVSTVLDKTWFGYTEFQHKCFQGAAEYWQAMASKDLAKQRGSGYGEEIARLNRAESFLKDAVQFAHQNKIPSTLSQNAEALLHLIGTTRSAAKHDLDTIYLENIPADNTLTAITGVAMVKPTALPEFVALPNEPKLFREVMPKELVALNLQFFERINGLYSVASSEADFATSNARTTLSSVGLPGSLEAVKSDNPLPDGLWAKVEHVQQMGGVGSLRATFEDIKSASRRTMQTMASIDEALDREVRIDDTFRARYPDCFATPSRALCQDVRDNNRRMREAYASAQATDDKTDAELNGEANIECWRLLSSTRSELTKLFPVGNPDGPCVANLLDFDEELDGKADDSNANPHAAKLERKLEELSELIEQREQRMEQFKQVLWTDFSDRTTALLVKSRSGDFSAITSMHGECISQCESLQKEVAEGVSKQEQLLTEVLALNQAFVASKQTDPKALQTNEAIRRAEESVAKFFALHTQLSAGNTFYSNLQSKLTALQQSSDDLAFGQQWMRQEFEASKTQQYLRNSQETKDREMAEKLAQEFNAPSAPTAAVAGVTHGYANLSLQPPPPTTQATAASDAFVYGTAVSGPPAHTTTVYSRSGAATSPFTAQPSTFPLPPAVDASNSFGNFPSPPPANPYIAQPANAMAGYPAVPASARPAPQQHAQFNYPASNAQFSTYPGNNQAFVQPVSQQAPPQYPQQQPVVNAQSATQPSPMEVDSKTNRLCEMGFERGMVQQALAANGFNEEMALNSLLSSSNNNNGTANAAPQRPPKPSSGMFGGLWGKK